MALNKKQTSLVTKIGIGLVAALLVLSFVPWGSLGSSGFGGGTTGGTGTGQLDAIAAKHSAAVAAYDQTLASEPTSYTVLVHQGNRYFDWALDVQKAVASQASLTGADRPMWLSATSYYERAVAVKPGDPSVTTDLAIAYFYTGQTDMAIITVEPVLKANPDFAQAFFNAGVFYNTAGQTERAAAVLTKYLELDPQGASGNREFAERTLKEIASPSVPATTTP
ncbi:MAG: tetratricopeptide repeat protein [Coriobacteriia bacterium]|nr:tetratricopeptide repeat protein [Coriobacteriia bacterium]